MTPSFTTNSKLYPETTFLLQTMTTSLALLAAVNVSLFIAIGENRIHCPETQTPNSHSICNIFGNTNIYQVIPQDFSDVNYCEWEYESQT